MCIKIQVIVKAIKQAMINKHSFSMRVFMSFSIYDYVWATHYNYVLDDEFCLIKTSFICFCWFYWYKGIFVISYVRVMVMNEFIWVNTLSIRLSIYKGRCYNAPEQIPKGKITIILFSFTLTEGKVCLLLEFTLTKLRILVIVYVPKSKQANLNTWIPLLKWQDWKSTSDRREYQSIFRK